jgi:hypothetical protein
LRAVGTAKCGAFRGHMAHEKVFPYVHAKPDWAPIMERDVCPMVGTAWILLDEPMNLGAAQPGLLCECGLVVHMNPDSRALTGDSKYRIRCDRERSLSIWKLGN